MAGLLAVRLRLPRLADQLANGRHVGPKLLSTLASGGRRRTRKSNSIPIARETLKATRETNSAQKTRVGLWAPPKQRITQREARDLAKQYQPLQGPEWLVFDRIVSV
jgi:hypothetical protein